MLSGTITFSAAVKLFASLTSVFLVHSAWNMWSDCPCKERVKVQVCTEALCPGCQQFVLKEVIPTYKTLGDKVMDLQIVPYGNARVVDDQVTCQHGIGECDANVWELCMIHAFPDPKQYLPMLECLENALPMGSHDETFPVSVFETCAQQANLAFPKIQLCHDDAATAKMVVDKAEKDTPSDHKYVPWTVINGEHMDEEHDDLMTAVCKAYKAAGGSHPACDKMRTEKRSLFEPCSS